MLVQRGVSAEGTILLGTTSHMIHSCNCALCKKEAEWEREHGMCYRCSHNMPCQYADERGEPCCTLLDVIARHVE